MGAWASRDDASAASQLKTFSCKCTNKK
jgi:hypothetical protein